MEVVFLNRLPHPATMHPHGLQYTKSSEGARYSDGTQGEGSTGQAVHPG